MIVTVKLEVDGEVRRERAVCRPVMPAPRMMMCFGDSWMGILLKFV
jgi:hypothetical protein